MAGPIVIDGTRRDQSLTAWSKIAVMDAALAGVLGAGIGVVAGIAGSVVTNTFAARRERETWRRAQTTEAYARALNHLTRAAARRSEFDAHGRPFLSKEDTREWFLDLADAEHPLAIAAGFSQVDVRQSLVEAFNELTSVVQIITGSE